MKPVLYVIALVAIGAAAFFSNAAKAKLKEQQEILSGLTADNKRASAKADTLNKDLGTKGEDLTIAKQEKAEAEQTIDKLKADETTFQREISDLEGTLEEQANELSVAEKAVEAVKAALMKFNIDADGGGIESLGDSINSLEDQKKVLVQEVGELETTIEGARKTVDNNRAEIVRLGKRKDERNARFRLNALESVITAVDQDWGFVVIGAGKNIGFTPQTRLTVKRSGRAIAEIRPSSIEANQTIAEIDWDTVAPGVRLQRGDRVILSKAATN